MKVLFIDIDVPVEYMKIFNLYDITAFKIVKCSELLRVKISDVKVTTSRNGNVHVRLILKEDIDPKTAIMLHFCIGEDHKRLTHTIRRYLSTGKLLEFIWINRHEVSKCSKCSEEVKN